MNSLNSLLPVLIILASLLFIAYWVNHFAQLPKNISVLFIVQPLVGASMPIMVFIGGIVSKKMASDPSLVTLPLGLTVAGVASATIPAAYLAHKIGRRNATIVGMISSVIGSVSAGLAIMQNNFILFCVAGYLLGATVAFIQQLRFAAIESVKQEKDINKALSVLMFAGLFSAFLGPEVAMFGKTLFAESIGFSGAFFVLAFMVLVSMIIMLRFENTDRQENQSNDRDRPLLQIIKQPIFIISVIAAALSYGLMSYIMTSTPLSMHQVHHHSLSDTKWVIQSHIAAMFIPSLITTWLSNKIGIKNILFIGSSLFAVVLIIATQGHSVLHYWWALIILGIAWNFLFFSGTSLLHFSYKPHEKHKVQAINDFSVFTFQGASSLMAGWVLFNYGWNGVIISAIPFVIVMFAISIYYTIYSKRTKELDK